MSLSGLEYLQHILDEADYLARRSADLSLEEFLADQDLRRAFVRSITIIGEAAKQVPGLLLGHERPLLVMNSGVSAMRGRSRS